METNKQTTKKKERKLTNELYTPSAYVIGKNNTGQQD